MTCTLVHRHLLCDLVTLSSILYIKQGSGQTWAFLFFLVNSEKSNHWPFLLSALNLSSCYYYITLTSYSPISLSFYSASLLFLTTTYNVISIELAKTFESLQIYDIYFFYTKQHAIHISSAVSAIRALKHRGLQNIL